MMFLIIVYVFWPQLFYLCYFLFTARFTRYIFAQKNNCLSPFLQIISLSKKHYSKRETTARYVNHGSYDKKT